MERELECGTKNPVALFVLFETILAVILALYLVLWILFLFPSSHIGNIGGVLTSLMLIAAVLYVFVTPLVGLAFLGVEICMPYLRSGERSKIEYKVFRRFLLHMASWIVMLMACYSAFVSALGGDVPFHLQNTRIVEGPDTHYARSGFQKLLGRPVPSHVSQIYYRNQNGIMDEHETLQFTTTDPSFVRNLVHEFRLEQRDGTEYEGDYGDYNRKLFYNRDTGDVKFEWITY